MFSLYCYLFYETLRPGRDITPLRREMLWIGALLMIEWISPATDTGPERRLIAPFRGGETEKSRDSTFTVYLSCQYHVFRQSVQRISINV